MKRAFVAVLASAAFFAAPVVHGVDTTITGARMELINKGDEVLFSGGVKLDRGIDHVRSRQMRTNKTRDKVTLTGNVRLVRKASSTDTWKAFGDLGFYNTKDGTGYLIGSAKRAHVERTEILSSTMTRVTDIYADRIDFAREGQRAFAQGNVYGRTTDPQTGDVYEFHSQEAEHRGDEKRVILTGPTEKPVLTQTGKKGTRRVTGKTIIYYIDTRRLVAKNAAQAVMRQPKDQTRAIEKKKGKRK